MEIIYFVLIIIYSTLPTYALFTSQQKIYSSKFKDSAGWHLNYIYKFLIAFSFLPLLYIPNLDLGLKPNGLSSLVLILLTINLSIIGIDLARKRQLLQFYIGGVEASIMEEILFRGVIFGLVNNLTSNDWISLVISSLAFGIWHLKNIPWTGRKSTIRQFFYTTCIAGPLFAFERIFTGDLYLAMFTHYLMDTTVTFAPNWMRKYKLVLGRPSKDL